MFDLSRDFSSITQESNDQLSVRQLNTRRGSKRKRVGGIDDFDLTNGLSGAGSKIPTHKVKNGIGWKMRKVEYSESVEPTIDELISLTRVNLDGFDYYRDNKEDSALRRLRRGLDKEEVQGDDDVTMRLVKKEGEGQRLNWWCTYKYRPILGLVTIDQDMEIRDDEYDGKSGLEVVLVERPMWDVDLPPRFYGDQEWVK